MGNTEFKKQNNPEVAQYYKRQLPSEDFFNLEIDCSRQTYAKHLTFLRPGF